MIITTLAAFPSPTQGVWHLGPIPIRAYAMCIIAGIIAALLIGDRRWVARGGEPGVIYDIALWAVPFGLVGGRLYHVMTDWQTYFGPGGAGPAAALRIWDGGLGIWGAVALGGVGAWIACRRRGIPLPAFGDAIAPGIVLAQAIGRLGNYFNQELYGRVTDVPWGMEIFYRRDPSGIIDVHSLNGVSTGEVAAVVHPTFLYELLWNLLVFVLLILIDRWWRIGHGRLFASYVALYCVGRFCVELLRDDTATHLAGIRINSYTSVFVFLGAVVYIILAPKGREDPSLLRGRDTDDDELLAPELTDELVAVAGSSGLFAAAKVAGAEDGEYDAESREADEAAAAESVIGQSGDSGAEPVDAESVTAEESTEAEVEAEPAEVEAEAADVEAEPAAVEAEAETEPEPVDVEPEDEAIVEAEAAAPGVEVETAAAGDEELIDDDHDPVDDPEFEEFLGADDSVDDDADDDSADNAAADVREGPPGDVAEGGVPPVDGPEAVDAAIDEAVAIEQVADSGNGEPEDEGEPVDEIVDGGDVSAEDAAIVVVDPVESDVPIVIVSSNTEPSDTEESAPDTSMVVSTGPDTEEAASVEGGGEADEEPGEIAPPADEEASATPITEDESAQDEAAEGEVAADAAAEDEATVAPETSPPAPATLPATPPAANGVSERRSGLGRLFRRAR